jgi:hypothetical protein
MRSECIEYPAMPENESIFPASGCDHCGGQEAMKAAMFLLLAVCACKSFETVVLVPTNQGTYRIARIDWAISDEAEFCKREEGRIKCKKVNVRFPE